MLRRCLTLLKNDSALEMADKNKAERDGQLAKPWRYRVIKIKYVNTARDKAIQAKDHSIIALARLDQFT